MKLCSASLLIAFWCSLLAAPLLAADRPNIVLILADDLGYGDVGCYGQKKIQTPNIDRLAAEGMKFTHFYAGASVCAPSRCVLMTGKQGGRCRVRGNAPWTQRLKQSLMPDDLTVAELLKQAGYATALVGKWGLGDFDTPGHPLDQGFEFFFGYLDQVHAHVFYPEWLWRNRNKIRLPNEVRPIPVGKDGVWGIGGIATKKSVYSPQLMLDEALQFIEQNRSRPFFLYFATTIPHANNEAAAEVGNGAEVPTLGEYEDKPWPEPEKGYAAMITYLDGQVGAILRHLERLRLDNTLVIFASDNGPEMKRFTGYDPAFFQSSGPYRGFKRDHTDGGIRVPFVARWPGKIQPERASEHVGYFGDIMATVAELAGVATPDVLDSVSLVPTLLSRPEQQRRHAVLCWEYHGASGCTQAVLLDGRWKALRNRGRNGPLELYDLHTDPSETHDLAAAHPEMVAKAEEALQREHLEAEHWPLRDPPVSASSDAARKKP